MDKLNAWIEMIKELSDSRCFEHNDKLVEAFNSGIDLAIKIVVRYKDELLNNPNTVWLRTDECLDDSYSQMYLAYQPGYPLMVADWQTGHGFRDVRTDRSIQPVLLARISPPNPRK